MRARDARADDPQDHANARKTLRPSLRTALLQGRQLEPVDPFERRLLDELGVGGDP